MNPRDALHQQEILRDSMSRHAMRRYLDGVMGSIKKTKTGPVLEASGGEMGDITAASLDQLLGESETFYVSADMSAVADAAGHGLDGTDAFTHDMWPTDSGFLLFEDGWVYVDVWGRPLVTNALAWQRRSYNGHAGTIVFEFSKLGDQRDPLTLSLTEQQVMDLATDLGTRYQLHGTRWIPDSMRVGPPTFTTPEGYRQYAEEHGWTMNAAEEEGVGGFFAKFGPDAEPLPETTNVGRPIMALLMLMQQTIAATERYDLRPKNPKRARRMRVPGQVTVIRLRHEASQREPGMTNVEWQHRWLVRGHWRWQACGADYPMAVEQSPGVYRARIFIAPFVKGPDGKPFAANKKVNALVR